MSAHSHPRPDGDSQEGVNPYTDLDGNPPKRMRTMNGNTDSGDEGNMSDSAPASTFELMDWPSFGPTMTNTDLSFSFPGGDMPIPPDISLMSTLPEDPLDGLDNINPAQSMMIQIGQFVSVAPRNDSQRVWVGRSPTDPNLLTITQGKKFKITITLINNNPVRSYQPVSYTHLTLPTIA